MKARVWMAIATLWFAGACESDPTALPELAVDRVEIEPGTVELVVGDTVRLVARPMTAGGDVLGSVPVTWATTGQAHLTLAPAGLQARITATAAGTATITATAAGKTGQAQIVVTDPGSEPGPTPGPVATVELEVDSIVLAEGVSHTFTATARDAQGLVVSGRFAQWSSSDPSVAPVGPLGEVTAVRAGTSLVTARIDGRTGSATVRVTADYPWDVVFSGWNGVPGEHPRIYAVDLADPEGTPVRMGPDGGAANPTPSPDGSRIAWIAIATNQLRGIYTSAMDGTDVQELLLTDASCGQLAWSPDGTRIAFACRMDGDDLDIWVMDAGDGGNLTNLTDDHPHNQEWPAWSPELPDGSFRIAYMQYVDGEPRIWTMKQDGTDAKQVTSGMDAHPAWSPDGTTIAFVRTGIATFGDIWVVDADGGNERGLVGLHLAGPQLSPTWSPDGRLLAFSSTHETYGSGDPVSQIFTVWADGSKLARRTSGELDKHSPAWRVR